MYGIIKRRAWWELIITLMHISGLTSPKLKFYHVSNFILLGSVIMIVVRTSDLMGGGGRWSLKLLKPTSEMTTKSLICQNKNVWAVYWHQKHSRKESHTAQTWRFWPWSVCIDSTNCPTKTRQPNGVDYFVTWIAKLLLMHLEHSNIVTSNQKNDF